MIRTGSRVNLIKSVNLVIDKKKMISVDKNNPCKGTIISTWRKMIAGKPVIMCSFHPDKVPEGYNYSFGLKAFEEIKEA